MIALTFDDGPNDPYTRQILAVLDASRVKATFFILGKWAQRQPEIVREVHSAGHEIGNHTYSHPSLPQVSQREGGVEITIGGLAIYRTGATVTCFRAPFGNIPEWKLPLASVTWDIHGNDWVTQKPDEICRPIFDYLDTHDSGIVLLHDGFYKEFGADRSGTVEATRRILARYPGKRFGTVSQCSTLLSA